MCECIPTFLFCSLWIFVQRLPSNNETIGTYHDSTIATSNWARYPCLNVTGSSTSDGVSIVATTLVSCSFNFKLVHFLWICMQTKNYSKESHLPEASIVEKYNFKHNEIQIKCKMKYKKYYFKLVYFLWICM